MKFGISQTQLHNKVGRSRRDRRNVFLDDYLLAKALTRGIIKQEPHHDQTIYSSRPVMQIGAGA